ncbi:LOW QUALITY PROTEIN: mitogen-activated protein kinase kinase kinase 18-like [Actinidia eriantha]|uniref:LOW QUALITY PROTEIN: mitogen-activated protein kinase kinase kinase 18-like n=1 Tax=Actinidia eriantha TaxID=165200 RepID=UPI002590A481|nr:LOW QUALITY PROTEIN: mitogen-activated protein kinase kinase kinase 18-like [Actinidia eriantha]
MNWTRGRTIGRGSSASVSIATSRHSGDIFAVKTTELSQSQSLQREQKILSTLISPNIVTYIGYDVTNENNKFMYNLLLEYMPGGTLSDAIHDVRLDEAAIGFYTHQILQGLEYIHSSGVAHCDIKGQNILISEGGAKLADFGFAKWINPAAENDNTAAVAIGGTPMFMAPEVARGEEQGFPADIWALGCTIIEMATGESPWPNFYDPVSVLYRVGFSREIPEFPDFLSDQARDFLGKCLRRDPKERWTAKELLKHPFLREKQILEFNSNSPTSILDQGVWNSIEEPESLYSTSPSSCLNSPAKRIRRLECSGEPNWTVDENWITIRSNNNEQRQELMEGIYHEDNLFFGSVTASICDEMELEDFLIDPFEGRNVRCSTCTEHRVVLDWRETKRDC